MVVMVEIAGILVSEKKMQAYHEEKSCYLKISNNFLCRSISMLLAGLKVILRQKNYI